MDAYKILPGKPLDYGTVITVRGVYFSIFSRHATRIFLELFERQEDDAPFQTVELDPKTNRTGDTWHVFVQGLKPGALYLYRADGPFDPKSGFRFDAKQYLLTLGQKRSPKGRCSAT